MTQPLIQKSDVKNSPTHQPAIQAQGVGKRYARYHADRPRTFQEAVVAGLRRLKPVESFWALQNVSFSVYPGEMVGILGPNGAGKSTLLQLLGGIGRADRGQIRVNGRVGALLDLGAGFHGDLTGRENVMINAVVAGLSRKAAARQFDEIVEFAELTHAIENPVRTYSTGMQMRLAFALAVHTQPQVLLVDEFLSVGDMAFQTKCLQRITQMKEDGCAIVLISHSPDQIRDLCDRALWLRSGQVVAYGEPPVVVGQYTTEMRAETLRRTPIRPPQATQWGTNLEINHNRFGSLEAEITDVQVRPNGAIAPGDSLHIEIEYYAPNPIESPIFNLSISREDGTICLDTSTEENPEGIATIHGQGRLSLSFERLDLANGRYFINVGIFEKSWEYTYDFHWHVYPLIVGNVASNKGLLNPPHQWQVRTRSPVQMA